MGPVPGGGVRAPPGSTRFGFRHDGYAFVGTMKTVTRALETTIRRQPVDGVFCDTCNGLVPHDVLMRSIEAFQTRIMLKFA